MQLKPSQIAVHLKWKNQQNALQHVCALADSLGLLEKDEVTTIAVSFDNLAEDFKKAFEYAERAVKDNLVVEINVKDATSMTTFHARDVKLAKCSLVEIKDVSRFIVNFEMKKVRRNEIYVLSEDRFANSDYEENLRLTDWDATPLLQFEP